MTAEQSTQRIATMVDRIRRLWTVNEAARLCALGVAGVAGWLLAVVVLDNVTILGRLGLSAGWGVLAAGVIAWSAVAAWRLRLRRPGDGRFALMYESRTPGFGNRLINSVQLVSQRPGGEEGMTEAVLLENAEHLDPVTAARAVDRRPLRQALAAGGLCLLLSLGYAGLRPTMTANALARLLQPASPPAHLLHTEIEVVPGDTRVLEGEGLVVEARLSGHLAERAEIAYRLADSSWVTEDMERTGAGAFRYAGLESLVVPARYRVRAGRTETREFAVEIQRRPRLDRLQVEVTPPDYAGDETRRIEPDRGDVTALAGSRIGVRITADHALLEGALAMADGTKVAAEPDPTDPHTVVARFVLNEDGSYRVHFTDSEGVSNARSAKYNLTVQGDEAPLVAVTRPARDLMLPAKAKLEIAARGKDDIGLGLIVLQIRLGDGKWADHKQWRMEGTNVRERVVETSLSLADFGVEADDSVLYRVAAEDRRHPVPNRSVSRTWAVTVTEPGEGRAPLTLQQQRRLIDLLESVLKLQRENLEDLEKGEKPAHVRTRQDRIRDLTLGAIAKEEKAIQPKEELIRALRGLTGGEMLLASQGARKLEAAPSDDLRDSLKGLMQRIISRLREIMKRASSTLDRDERLAAALERLTPREREEMVEEILAELDKLDKFVKQQQEALANVKKISRDSVNELRPEDADYLNDLMVAQDDWGNVFNESIEGLDKLSMQDFADGSVVEDYKDLVAEIEETEEAIEHVQQPGAFATSKGGAFKFISDALLDANNEAVEAQKKLEQALSADPETAQYVQEESAVEMEIDAAGMPEELYDLAGELAAESPPLQDTDENEEDVNNFWRQPGAGEDAKENPDWEIDDGPTSEFSGSAVSGEKLPDDNMLSGRAGDGRQGRSAGQMIGKTSKNLQGRQTPARVDRDPFEEGVIRQLREQNTGGSTGGGKAAGSGQQGLQGEAPEPEIKGLTLMKDWQQKVREKKMREATLLRALRIGLPYDSLEFARLMELFQEASVAKTNGRYRDGVESEEMTLQEIQPAAMEDSTRGAYRHIQPAYPVADEQRRHVLDAMEEPVPEEYRKAHERYFEQLSENSR